MGSKFDEWCLRILYYIIHGRRRCHHRRREQSPSVHFLCPEACPGRSRRLCILRPQVCAVVKRSPRILLAGASRGAVAVSSASLYYPRSTSCHRSSNFSLYARPHFQQCFDLLFSRLHTPLVFAMLLPTPLFHSTFHHIWAIRWSSRIQACFAQCILIESTSLNPTSVVNCILFLSIFAVQYLVVPCSPDQVSVANNNRSASPSLG